MKVCSACNRTLTLDRFRSAKHVLTDGSVRYYKASQCRDCGNKENLARYHRKPKSAHREASHRYNVKRYGLTLEEHQSMLEAQDYRCFVCNVHQDDTRFSRLCIDHDHKTGKVRKLLCSSCNSALGMAKDDPQRLIDLASYVQEHSG